MALIGMYLSCYIYIIKLQACFQNVKRTNSYILVQTAALSHCVFLVVPSLSVSPLSISVLLQVNILALNPTNAPPITPAVPAAAAVIAPACSVISSFVGVYSTQ